MKEHVEAVKVRADAPAEVLECGDVFFFYRPKVNTEHPKGVDDVQRLYFVLRPRVAERGEEEKQSRDSGKEGEKESRREGSAERDTKEDSDSRKNEAESPTVKSRGKAEEGGHGSEKIVLKEKPLLRFILVGKKILPDIEKKLSRPHWGFVDLVTTHLKDIKDALAEEEYETATRGHRHKPAARPVGEGAYCIVRHTSGRGSHTHFVYERDHLEKDHKNKPQEALHIEDEGSFIIQVRNPEAPAPNYVGLGNKRRAHFPAHLQATIGSRRFIPLDPPDFLNYEGCEFILIPASDNVEEELGLHIEHEHEKLHPCPELMKILPEQSIKSEEVRKPLFEGEWA